MSKYSIYITEPNAISSELVKAALELQADIDYSLILGSTDFSVGDCANCDTVLIRSATQIEASIAGKMPKLKHVVRVGTGLDNVDLAYCNQAGIRVYNAPGANADAVAEYVVTVSLAVLRKLHLLYRSDIVDWNRFKFNGRSITGQTIGIVGFGNIGKLLYQKLLGLGCSRFLIYDPYVTTAPDGTRLVELAELIAQSQIISLHVPLLPSTTHLIDSTLLGLLQPEAILINASRGAIVDETALLAALAERQFSYVADAVEGEPRVNLELLKNPNILITPHIASLTNSAEVAMVQIAIANLLADTPAVQLPAFPS